MTQPIIRNNTWTYGNWGGPGWSGGEFTPAGQEPKWEVGWVSELDKTFKTHDQAYNTAEKAWDASAKTPSDIAKFRDDILKADKDMLIEITRQKDSGTFGPSPIPGGLPASDDYYAANQATAAFKAKMLWDVLARQTLRNPDGETVPGYDYDPFTGTPWAVPMDPSTNTFYTAARNWTFPRDPLVLDLDGDGIETMGIDPSHPLLFDMDGDGTKTGTGWIKADDGLVVLDRNGNGLIDSGAELFGDSTVLTHGPRAGQKALNGFEALADQDSNADGIINSADAVYTKLRIWQDANQDGISQASELKTLSAAGIVSINTTGTASNTPLGSGNTQVMAGSFTRSSGATGTAGVAELSGSLLLASNNFYRQFTDDPAVTASAAVLPQMQGAGWVRDLREAMSLGTPAAQALQSRATAFAAAIAPDGQHKSLNVLCRSSCNSKTVARKRLWISRNRHFNMLTLSELVHEIKPTV